MMRDEQYLLYIRVLLFALLLAGNPEGEPGSPGVPGEPAGPGPHTPELQTASLERPTEADFANQMSQELLQNYQVTANRARLNPDVTWTRGGKTHLQRAQTQRRLIEENRGKRQWIYNEQ